MSPEIKLQRHSIVAVGDLNPAIFQPAWFAGEGLITRGEAQAATVQVISAQATQFEVDWLSLQVLPERFAATTTNEAFFQHLHDLVAATFSRLVHTPIRMLGINFNCHCHLEDPKWSELSDVLAPKAPWSRLLESPQIHGLDPRSNDGRHKTDGSQGLSSDQSEAIGTCSRRPVHRYKQSL